MLVLFYYAVNLKELLLLEMELFRKATFSYPPVFRILVNVI